jgi:hypothetical protein
MARREGNLIWLETGDEVQLDGVVGEVNANGNIVIVDPDEADLSYWDEDTMERYGVGRVNGKLAADTQRPYH